MGGDEGKTSSEIQKYYIPLQNLKSSITLSQQNEGRYGCENSEGCSDISEKKKSP